MKIKELSVNDTGTVTGYTTSNKAYRQKLLSMGLVRGAEFVVVRKAPLGDPIEIELCGFRLTLRGDEASILEVEKK